MGHHDHINHSSQEEVELGADHVVDVAMLSTRGERGAQLQRLLAVGAGT